jgi:hypothetical protein
VRQAVAGDLHEAPVVARGGNGQILQFDHAVHRALAGLGALERNGPGAAVGLRADGAQFAVERRQRMAHPMALQHLGHAIDRVALGDAAQVDRERRVLARAARRQVELQAGVRRQP